MKGIDRKVKEFIRNHPEYKRVFTGRRAFFRSSNDVTYDQLNRTLIDHVSDQTYQVIDGRHFIGASLYITQRHVFIINTTRERMNNGI